MSVPKRNLIRWKHEILLTSGRRMMKQREAVKLVDKVERLQYHLRRQQTSVCTSLTLFKKNRVRGYDYVLQMIFEHFDIEIYKELVGIRQQGQLNKFLLFRQFDGECLSSRIPTVHIQTYRLPLQCTKPIMITYEPTSKTWLLVDTNNILYKYHYDNKGQQLKKTGQVVLQNINRIIMLSYVVQKDVVLLITEDGRIMNVDNDGIIDCKASNDDGIIGGTLSPTQEYLYVVTKNKTLLQLDEEYDMIKQIQLDQNEQVDVKERVWFSWRADGQMFVMNYAVKGGRKAITRDRMMIIMISPVKSDPDGGLVQSVSEKGRNNMSHVVAWQPSGGIIVGSDIVCQQGKELSRIIFWETNGLRHLEFGLEEFVKRVLEVRWSVDSQLLMVEVEVEEKKRKLLVYYRANYHWFCKTVIKLQEGQCWLMIKHRYNQLVLIKKGQMRIIGIQLALAQSQWKSQTVEKTLKQCYQYMVDGHILLLTDFSKCMIPPPMSMYKLQVIGNIQAVHGKYNFMIVISQEQVVLYDCPNQVVKVRTGIGLLQSMLITDLVLVSSDPLVFSITGKQYTIKNGQIQQIIPPIKFILHVYQLFINQECDTTIQLTTSLNQSKLIINDKIISSQCSSYLFYHEFLLFTVSSNNMYDKLFVLNLRLDKWVYIDQNINNVESNIMKKLEEIENKKLLNHRLVERGAKLVAITKGKAIMQMLRGNLEGIYSKIVMINLVRKAIKVRQYRSAYELIRTHKLDFNLLVDCNPKQFVQDIRTVLDKIAKVDYINLLVAQLKQGISSQLNYAVTKNQLQIIQRYFNEHFPNSKILTICDLISTCLRQINKDYYILSIFTSDIKCGKLNNVLFEIKIMKQNQIPTIQYPHIIEGQYPIMKKNKLSPQQVLQFVCWLVDANSIYEASLLTYDIELAAITARCTQKDPKQYIPYLQSLKAIENGVQLRSKICLDLKKYEQAMIELAAGNEQQIDQALALIKTHKLYKRGLIVFDKREQLRQIKEIMINDLLAAGQSNQAYRMCQSIKNYRRALEIAIEGFDGKKIKECLDSLYDNCQERKQQAKRILELVKEQNKSKVQLGRLYAYTEQYDQAVRNYLKGGNYKKAYKYINRISNNFYEQMQEGFKLCCSLKLNELIKDKKDFEQKKRRLDAVHKDKRVHGVAIPDTFKQKEDDMYSQMSGSNRSVSSYSVSTTTGMKRKKDKKRSILTRNVKEGSVLQEQYLLAYLGEIQSRSDEIVSNVYNILEECKLLVQHLLYMNLVGEAERLRDQARKYIDMVCVVEVKGFARVGFEQLHPQVIDMYRVEKNVVNMDSFNYLL